MGAVGGGLGVEVVGVEGVDDVCCLSVLGCVGAWGEALRTIIRIDEVSFDLLVAEVVVGVSPCGGTRHHRHCGGGVRMRWRADGLTLLARRIDSDGHHMQCSK